MSPSSLWGYDKAVAIGFVAGLLFITTLSQAADGAQPPNFGPINAANSGSASLSGDCATENDTLDVTITDDEGATVTATDIACAGTTYSTNVNVSSLSDGALEVQLLFEDGSSWGVSEAPFIAQKDTLPPTLVNDTVYVAGTDLSTDADGYEFTTDTPAFEFDSPDIQTGTCQIDSLSAEDCSGYAYTVTTPLDDGPHTLTIVAEDEYGNELTAAFDFTVNANPDTTAPTLTASSHIVIATSSFSVMPQSAYPTADDDTDDEVEITYSPITFAAGTHEVTWTATDDAENESTLTTDITIIEPISVDLPDGCTVTDSAEVEHEISGYFGICAFQAALDAGDITAFSVSDSPFGLSLDSVNGVPAGATEFWAQWLNEGFASCGVECQSLGVNDIYSIVLSDWMANTENPAQVVAFQINSLLESEEETPDDTGGGGGGVGSTPSAAFSVPQALAFLSLKQNANGSYGTASITDWVAIAFAAQDPGSAKMKLRNYLLTANPGASSVTDYERHAMALMALNINPFNGTSIDYIAPIVSAFDGTQIGNASLVNDDVFALFPLLKAGYGTSDVLIQKSVAFIVSKQLPNGSWENSVDVTAASVQALADAQSLPGVTDALTKAEAYLRAQQQSNGSLGNSFSTSWSLQAIAALGDSASGWMLSGKTPLDYLASIQVGDGGVDASASVDDRAWATAYAVPGALGKTWNSLLSSFSKPSGQTTEQQAATTQQSATTTATTTPAATSTPEVATTTLTLTLPVETVDEIDPPQPRVLSFSVTPSNTVTTDDSEIQVTPNSTVEEVAEQLAAAATTEEAGINWTYVAAALFALAAILGYQVYKIRRNR